MIFLQYTTKTEKAIIREAMALKGYRDAIRHGWKRLSSGVNRTGFRKQNVVVKFTMRKLQRYQSAKHDMLFYLKTPPHQRKYLARIFAVADDRVVQRYANQSRWTSKQKALGYRILDTLRIIDADVPEDFEPHNMGLINGRPVVYDFSEEYVR